MPGGWEDAALTNVYVLVSAEKGRVRLHPGGGVRGGGNVVET